MPNSARRLALGLAALMLSSIAVATADGLDAIRQRGALRVAVYNDFPPYSSHGKGIDTELARALGEQLGLAVQIVEFNAGEDMSDDLRNMVWKGHYLGTQPGDVMMHVPVDAYLARQNDKVRIFGPYHLETLAVARNPAHVPPVEGSAAKALEVFTRERIGVETGTLADDFLVGVMAGRLRDNVRHFRNLAQAAEAMRAGEISAVMAPRAELEAAFAGDARFPIDAVRMPELRVKGWAVGMAVKSDDEPLATALSQALATLEQNGTVARIFAHYGVTRAQPDGH